MKIIKPAVEMPPQFKEWPSGAASIRVKVGGGGKPVPGHWDPGTWTPAIVWEFYNTTRAELKAARGTKPKKDTLRWGIDRYPEVLKTDPDRPSATTIARRAQQQLFFADQLVKLGAPVRTVEGVWLDPEDGEPLKNQAQTFDGATLGSVALVSLGEHRPRLREILITAWPKHDDDPYEGASTSNKYRFALFHLYTVLFGDDDTVVNPIAKVKTRKENTKGTTTGIDPRLVREIERRFPSTFGPSSEAQEARLGMLIHVQIEPDQLARLDIEKAFYDYEVDPVLVVPGRRKGRGLPTEPVTVPVTSYGLAACRRFKATPAAWGGTRTPSGHLTWEGNLNRRVKAVCREIEAAFQAKHHLTLEDLADFHVKRFKHSLLDALREAAPNLVDKHGEPTVPDAVQLTAGHASAKTSARYTRKAAHRALVTAYKQLQAHLERVYATPLVKPEAVPVPAAKSRRRAS